VDELRTAAESTTLPFRRVTSEKSGKKGQSPMHQKDGEPCVLSSSRSTVQINAHVALRHYDRGLVGQRY